MAKRDKDKSKQERLEHADPDAIEAGLAALEARIGYSFGARPLLLAAMTHPSYNNVTAKTGEVVTDNQRLEFLGDAVLDLVVGERLFEADPAADPGTLTQRRIALVTERSLARRGEALGLGDLLRIGPGQDRALFVHRASVLADTFEALLGALYLDGGLDAVRRVVELVLGDDIRSRPSVATLKAPKASLQEQAQGLWAATPRYSVLSTAPEYEVEVRAGGHLSATGRGMTRREAEDRAAENALSLLAQAPAKQG